MLKEKSQNARSKQNPVIEIGFLSSTTERKQKKVEKKRRRNLLSPQQKSPQSHQTNTFVKSYEQYP